MTKQSKNQGRNYMFDITVNDIKGRRKVSVLSGSESFIYSVALRLTLIKMNQRGKGNFLMIDEGWGNLDETNIKNIPLIYEIFRREFKYVILVSHIEEFKNNADRELMINIDNKRYSKINV